MESDFISSAGTESIGLRRLRQMELSGDSQRDFLLGSHRLPMEIASSRFSSVEYWFLIHEGIYQAARQQAGKREDPTAAIVELVSRLKRVGLETSPLHD